MNPRDLQKAMKRMGIKQQSVEATEVIIRQKDKELVITDPDVTKVNMMGNETFQIMGKVHERNRELEISDEDVETVQQQASVSREEAEQALRKTQGDIAQAIMELQSA